MSLESILIFWKDLITAWTGWIGILPIIHFRNNFLDEWLSIFYGNNWVLCCDVLSFKWKVINLRLVFWIKYNAREVFDIFVTQKVKKGVFYFLQIVQFCKKKTKKVPNWSCTHSRPILMQGEQPGRKKLWLLVCKEYF